MRDIVARLEERGRGALFTLDSQISLEYRSLLENLFGTKFGAWQNDSGSVTYVNPHHFTTQLLRGKQIRYNNLAGSWNLSPSSGTTLLSGGGNSYALAKNNFILWNFDLENQGSTFFLDAAFAVFAYRSLEHSGTMVASGEHLSLGDTVNAAEIILPNAQSLELATRSYKLEQPGIHTLVQPDGTQKVVAVNAPLAESEFKPMDYKGLKNTKLLGKNWFDSLFHTRLGHDLWKILLAAALVLVILEIIIVKSEELRPATAASNPSTGSDT